MMENKKVSMLPEIEAVLKMARNDDDVVAVMLFGSHARMKAGGRSDIDICLVLRDASKALEKRIEYMISDNIDVQVLQSLPLYIKTRVLKEGRVLLSKDDSFLYALAIDIIKDYEGFRKYHREYLETVLHG